MGTVTRASIVRSKIKLLNLQQKAKDLLQMTKLHTLFEVSDNEADAISSFS